MSLIQKTAHNESILLTQTEGVKKVARFEGQMEKFSGHCFVLDPSMRAQGDS